MTEDAKQAKVLNDELQNTRTLNLRFKIHSQLECRISCKRLVLTRGGNAICVPYGDVPPIRVYFLAFESETGCLFSSLTLKQGAKFVRSIRARVPVHSTFWHPHIGFNLFVICSGN